MILDTSCILDIIDDVEAAVEKERELEAENVPLVIPSMTVVELYIGVGKVANTREERQTVEAVLDSYPLVDMTPSISRRAGRLLGQHMAETDDGEGPGIGKGDVAIAATVWSAMSLSSTVTVTSPTSPELPTKPINDGGNHSSNSDTALSNASPFGAKDTDRWTGRPPAGFDVGFGLFDWFARLRWF